MAKSKKTLQDLLPSVVIGTPENGETNDQNPLVVAGNLPNAGEGITVTIRFEATAGGPAPADATADTSDTSCWEWPFEDVNSGTYNITACAPGYEKTTVTGVIVPPRLRTATAGAGTQPRIAVQPLAHGFDLFLTVRDTISVDDAIYAVVILEHEHPKRFFDVRVDNDVAGRTGWRVTFALVPKGRYFRRSIVYRKNGPAVRESTLITV